MIVQNPANDAYRLPVMGAPAMPPEHPRGAARAKYWRTIDLRIVGWLVRAVSYVPVQVVGVAAGVALFWDGSLGPVRMVDRLVVSVIVAPCAAMVWGWVKQFANWSSGWYAKGREFAYAHLFLRCAKSIAEARRMVCERCSMRSMKGKHAYCGQCNCGKHRAARLSWKTKLAGFSCPMGKFSDAPKMTAAVILFWVLSAAALGLSAWLIINLF